MPLRAMSKITLALPAHVDVETLWQHVENRTVADTSKLFQSAHGLTHWKLNGPKGMQAPVGVVGRSASSRVFLWRTFADWRRMGNEIGINVLPLQHPKYYQLLDTLYTAENPSYGVSSRCQMHACGKFCSRRGMTTIAYGLIDLCRDHCRSLEKRGQLSEESSLRVHPGDDAPPAA